jgi:hypothetical protein
MLSISKRRSASNRTGPTRLDVSYLDAPDCTNSPSGRLTLQDQEIPGRQKSGVGDVESFDSFDTKRAGSRKARRFPALVRAVMAANNNVSPLDLMLAVMREPHVALDQRVKLALKALPHVHAKAKALRPLHRRWRKRCVATLLEPA